MRTEHPPESELRTALAAFETALTTPVVSGELADWVESLQETWQEASSQLHGSIQDAHPRQYEQIADADPSLLPRIEQLKAEDTELAQQREHVNQLLARAAQHVPKLEPDEAKAQKHMENLINEGLALVVRARKQEVSIETWFLEAFNRDRGAVD